VPNTQNDIAFIIVDIPAIIRKYFGKNNMQTSIQLALANII